jgi:GNAT superfamily N-acetyltransferase
MQGAYTIRTARPGDIAALPEIEHAASQLLRGHAPRSVLDEATSERAFREAQEAGRLWVACAGDTPVGFALVEMLADDLPHLEELGVHPDHGRRGVGTALVRAVCDWVHRSQHAAITLTTFREVPWNMPFYSGLGFGEVAAGELRPELLAVVADEAARGLERRRRVVMAYRPHGRPPGVVTYRVATVDDVDGIAALHASSWRRTYRGSFPDAFLDGDLAAERRGVWRERLGRQRADQFVCVAVVEGQVAGFVCAYGGEDPRWGSLIDNLHVAPDHRREGVGCALMRRAGAWLASSYGGCGVYLWVLEANTGARRFYERVGALDAGTEEVENPSGATARSCRYVWPTPDLLAEIPEPA